MGSCFRRSDKVSFLFLDFSIEGRMRVMKSVFKVVLAVVSIAVCLSATHAQAADYPTRSIRWIVPYVPGGTTDILARIMAARLGERMGQTVVVDNRPGAGNNIGTEIATKAAPDGYTWFLTNPANAINATLYNKLPFNFLQDMAPIAGLIRVPNVMSIQRNLPVKSVPEFVAHAKAKIGRAHV